MPTRSQDAPRERRTAALDAEAKRVAQNEAPTKRARVAPAPSVSAAPAPSVSAGGAATSVAQYRGGLGGIGHAVVGGRSEDVGPQWMGGLISVGSSGERFYDAVQLPEEEDGKLSWSSFHVGDTVMIRVDDASDTIPQVGRIDALWEDGQGGKWFECRWFYDPAETKSNRLPGHDKREIFQTSHIDEQPVESIDGPCTVLDWDTYQRWLDQTSTMTPEEEEREEQTTFVCRAIYHVGSGEFTPLAGASTLSEAVRVGGRKLQLPNPVVLPAAGGGAAGDGQAGGGGGSSSWGAALSAADAAPGAVAMYGKPMHGTVEVRKRRLGRFAEAASRLAPSAHPERMPRREKERGDVLGALRAAVLEGTLGGSLYLSGTPGTGKTATVHQALRELAADKSLPPFRELFVNGMKLTSAYEVRSILWEVEHAPHAWIPMCIQLTHACALHVYTQVYSILWEALTGAAVKPQRAMELLERRFAAPLVSAASKGNGAAGGGKGGHGGGYNMKRKGAIEKVILVLDELDYLVTAKQSVIYNLFEWATRGASSLVVVGISNTMDLPERLLPRVESRLNIRRVNFLPYSHQDIAAILSDRLGTLDAFAAGDGGVELCARKVSSVSGDVRRALEVCRLAAQVAEREEAGAIQAGGEQARRAPKHVMIHHIEEAHKLLRGSTLLLAVQSAPAQHKLMLACVVLLLHSTGRSEVDATQLRQRHRAICAQLHATHGAAAAEEFPVLQIPEQNEAVARLCAARLLDATGGGSVLSGNLRLTAAPEDVRHVVRGHETLKHLFPQTQQQPARF